MKEVYYYYIRIMGVRKVLKDEEMKRMIEAFPSYKEVLNGNAVTVCLLDDGSKVSRGVVGCTRTDEFDLEKGKNLAKYKAEHAIKRRKKMEVQNDNAVRVFINVRCPFSFHSELNPDLSIFERKILFGRKLKRECSLTLKLSCDTGLIKDGIAKIYSNVSFEGTALERIDKGDFVSIDVSNGSVQKMRTS